MLPYTYATYIYSIVLVTYHVGVVVWLILVLAGTVAQTQQKLLNCEFPLTQHSMTDLLLAWQDSENSDWINANDFQERFTTRQ